jgi:hypothetical protein
MFASFVTLPQVQRAMHGSIAVMHFYPHFPVLAASDACLRDQN